MPQIRRIKWETCFAWRGGLKLLAKKEGKEVRRERVDILALFLSTGLRTTGDGNIGAVFPIDDVRDFALGVRFVPGEVTVARRQGHSVPFVHEHCHNPCCWYWMMPDGSRHYYWERGNFEAIAAHNGKKKVPVDSGGEDFPEAGPCPKCGNIYTSGGFHDA